jgi:acetyltransferase-like isoleucine patch superfamily enzyme
VIAKPLARFLWSRRCVLGKGASIHRGAIIHNMLQRRDAISIGDFTHVKGELVTFRHGGSIRIGDYCYIGEYTKLWSAQSITIGNRVLIGHSVSIFDNLTHPISASARHHHYREIVTAGHPTSIDLSERPVVLCDDVWIGCMSIILRGVRVGEGAIIGAGSVVTKDVPAWTMAAGNPARVIRELEAEQL